MLPHQFVGITMRRVRWQEEQTQPAAKRFDKGLGLFPPMRRAAIDDQEDRTGGADQQAFEKLDKDLGIHAAGRLDHEPHAAFRGVSMPLQIRSYLLKCSQMASFASA